MLIVDSVGRAPNGKADYPRVKRVVAAAFSQRRKTLRNSLKSVVGTSTLDALGISPSARAQELSVAQFVALADHVTAQPAVEG